MKKNAIGYALASVLVPFFIDLAVAAALTVPFGRNGIELTIRVLCCILFLSLAIVCKYFYGSKYNKRVYK